MNWKARQNSDGGWAYGHGSSWTEPTVYALLAQSATEIQEGFDSGLQFIRSAAGGDGGFRPQAAVEESTWVTSLVALLPPEALGKERHARAIDWLKTQIGRESGWSYKLRQRLAGNRSDFPDGWPWFPGAAAWVTPTSLGILAFERTLSHTQDPQLRIRIDSGRNFLLARICADGGWNYGTSQVLGRDGDSYPETTGIALLALHGAGGSAAIERAKAAARKHLRNCRTAEGIAWLRMGLAAHGEKAESPFIPAMRTNMDFALTAISTAERNPLLKP